MTLAAKPIGVLIVSLAIAVACFLVPNYVDGYWVYLMTWMAVYAIAAAGLVVLMGWTGQVALSHAGMFGVGAYGTAVLNDHGVPWPVALIVTAVAAALLGAATGLPAARLRGFYLGIATLALGVLLQQVFIIWVPVTGGPSGLAVQPITWPGIPGPNLLWYLSVVVLAATLLCLSLLGRSGYGRCMKAVRDIEVATASIGISATRYKFAAFAISAFFAAVGGALFGQLISYISPDAFGSDLLLLFLVVVFVGGVDRLSGAVAGAVFVILLREVLGHVATSVPSLVGSGQSLAFGVLLILVVRYLPGGIGAGLRWPRRLSRAVSVPVQASK